jgi:ABC-type sugar transport system substrate-binding protein
VAYDSANGGTLLLNTLVKEYYARHPTIKPSITGIDGDFASLSISRQKVLSKLDKCSGMGLNQIFPTYWDPKNIATNFKLMLKRYPQTNIFCCAGDLIALEALKYYQQLHKKPLIFGGFDWLPEALMKIQEVELTASVGGLFLMGTIAITKIVDYQNGINKCSTSPNFMILR